LRRTETLVALLAVVLASVAALQIHGRLLFAAAAILLLVVVCLLRLRAAFAGRRRNTQTSNALGRAQAIRYERRKRYSNRL
jgi:uncharacterized protein (DUF58 family)